MRTVKEEEEEEEEKEEEGGSERGSGVCGCKKRGCIG